MAVYDFCILIKVKWPPCMEKFLCGTTYSGELLPKLSLDHSSPLLWVWSDSYHSLASPINIKQNLCTFPPSVNIGVSIQSFISANILLHPHLAYLQTLAWSETSSKVVLVLFVLAELQVVLGLPLVILEALGVPLMVLHHLFVVEVIQVVAVVAEVVIGDLHHPFWSTWFTLLDLIYTFQGDGLSVQYCSVGPFVSDHRIILAAINLRKLTPTLQKIKTRKTKDIRPSNFESEFNNRNIPETDNIDELNLAYNKELTQVYDKLAPVKEITITSRIQTPWFGSELNELKQNVRWLERKWTKYRLESCWEAYKVNQNAYYYLIRKKKKTVHFWQCKAAWQGYQETIQTCKCTDGE